jgi:bifunctional non-homologous end joining protein LigD
VATARDRPVDGSWTGSGPPIFIPFQHPRLVRAPPSGPDWLHEVKLDGDRFQARVLQGEVRWRSRNGVDRSALLPDLSARLADLPDCILDGELCALDRAERPNFSLLRARLGARQRHAARDPLVFFAFDLLHLNREALLRRPLAARHEALGRLLRRAPLDGPIRSAAAITDPDPLGWARREGFEGVVSKRLDSPYAPGERNDSWRKSKWRPSQEVVIGGWAMTGSRKFRSLLVGVYDDGVLRYVGRVHTGYPRRVMPELLARLRAVRSETCPFEAGDPPRKDPAVQWTRPVLVANIDFAEWTEHGRIRQASFKGLRSDKSPQDVVAEIPESPAE